MPILDQFGREIRPERVSRAQPAQTANVKPGDRQVAPGMNPDRLGRILRSANEGELDELLVLAEEMEERDLHYYSLLQTRKLAVTGAPVRVEGPEDGAAEEIIKAVQEQIVDAPWFRPMLLDFQDALGKGFSVLKPNWVTGPKQWSYSGWEFVDPRCFTFDRDTQREIRLRDQQSQEGRPLPAGLVVHYPHLRSSVPARCGLARLAVVTWMFKTFTINDWVTFAEVYGMPLRIAKYDPETTSPQDRAALKRVLANIGHDAAAIIPMGVEIEADALDSRAGGSGDVFLQLAEYFDKQMSKGILGQTMTADDGSSLAQAEVHERTGNKIFQADAHVLSNTVTDGVVRPFVQLNYGEKAPKIRLILDLEPAEDLEAFTKGALPWVQAGLKTSAKAMRERLGLPEPEGKEDELGGPAIDPNKIGPDGKPLAPAVDPNKQPPGKPASGKPKVAPNFKAQPDTLLSVNETERLADEATNDWEEVLGPFRETLEQIATEHKDYDSFVRALSKHYADRVDSNPLVKRLATEATKVSALAQSGQ